MLSLTQVTQHSSVAAQIAEQAVTPECSEEPCLPHIVPPNHTRAAHPHLLARASETASFSLAQISVLHIFFLHFQLQNGTFPHAGELQEHNLNGSTRELAAACGSRGLRHVVLLKLHCTDVFQH